MNPVVGFRQVAKRFGPVQVLHGVSFAFAPGRVYGVLGENGAGKSTLMKILAGYEDASDGEVEVEGRAVNFKGPREAETAGIVMIHQEFNLADDLTIAQNIFLGHELTRHGLPDDRTMSQRAAESMRAVGLQCSPDRDHEAEGQKAEPGVEQKPEHGETWLPFVWSMMCHAVDWSNRGDRSVFTLLRTRCR